MYIVMLAMLTVVAGLGRDAAMRDFMSAKVRSFAAAPAGDPIARTYRAIVARAFPPPEPPIRAPLPQPPSPSLTVPLIVITDEAKPDIATVPALSKATKPARATKPMPVPTTAQRRGAVTHAPRSRE